MSIVIRQYSDDDYDIVCKIIYDSFGYKKEKILDSRVVEFVACLDGDVVGYFNLLEEIDVVRNIKIYHLGYVCVDYSKRGNGIGRMMTEYAVNYAKEKGANRVELTSRNDRVAAHKLYLDLGFLKRDSSIFRKEFL